MKFTDLTRREISSLPVYQPGKPTELLAREYGLGLDSIIKLASNENPLGPPPESVEAIRSMASGVAVYPDNSGYELVQAICRKYGFEPGQITLAAGSNEIFYLLCDLFAEPGVEVIVGEFAFISYRIAALLAGASLVPVAMPGLKHDLEAMRAAVTPRTRLVFLPNPNNPTGTTLPPDEVAAFARSLPEWVILCYDEAYMEYEEEALDVQGLIAEGVRIIGTRTFSKIYGLAGLRVGYGYSDAGLASLLNRVRPPFNTANIAQAAAIAALRNDDWVRLSREVNRTGRAQLQQGIAAAGYEPFGEHGNFLLFKVDNAAATAHSLQEMGVIVRPLTGYGLPDLLRISIGSGSQNARFLDALFQLTR